jgi:hypothetical protein
VRNEETVRRREGERETKERRNVVIGAEPIRAIPPSTCVLQNLHVLPCTGLSLHVSVTSVTSDFAVTYIRAILKVGTYSTVDVGGRIILKKILEDGVVWTGLISAQNRDQWRTLVNMVMNLRLHKMLGNSLGAE